MRDTMKRLFDSLRGQGWTVEERDGPPAGAPACILERYGTLPADWLAFLNRVSLCVNAAQTVWLLCEDDFAGGSAFRWNEFELLSLQAAEGDEEWRRAIRAFWDGHLPIACSVGGAYAYHAIRLADGSVVHGAAPEFEETQEIAASFQGFAEMLAAGAYRL